MLCQNVESIVFLLGVRDSALWRSVKEKCCTNNKLQQLWFPLTQVMTASRQTQTTISYESAYKAFVSWCKSTSQAFMPSSVETIALYLVSLVQAGASTSKINQAFYSICWFHTLAGVKYNPCKESSWLKLCLEGSRRCVSQPVHKKEPISVETLQNFVNKFTERDCSLSNLRITSLVLLSFAVFFRFREVTKIRRSDIQLFPSHCSIFVSESKTDVYRLGKWVVIARTVL